MIFAEFKPPDMTAGLLAIIVGAVVVLFLAARFGFLGGTPGTGTDPEGSMPGVRGKGRNWQCHRCGTYFQPEHEQTMPNGGIRKWVDDRCPKCGWNKDWTDDNHNNRPDQYE